MRFNINNYVTVKLTEAGAQRLKNHHKELYDFLISKNGRTTIRTPEQYDAQLDKELEENDMKIRMQGWEFMEKLGHKCGPGYPQLFKTIIEMDDKDLFE